MPQQLNLHQLNLQPMMPQSIDVEDQLYAFSVKKNTGSASSCTIEVYEEYIEYITKKFKEIKLIEITYERDKQQKRLHFHCFLACPKNFLRTRLRRDGWNIHATLIQDINKWYSYIKKDQIKKIKSECPRLDIAYQPTEADYEDFAKWDDEKHPMTHELVSEMYTDEYIFSNIEL